MTASSDQADRLAARLMKLVADNRWTLNRAHAITITLTIDGRDVVQPWFDEPNEVAAPDTTTDLDDVEKDIIQALAEAEEPLTVEKLVEKSGHNQSTMYGKTQRLPRLVAEGIVVKVRQRGFKLTTFGRDMAAMIGAEGA